MQGSLLHEDQRTKINRSHGRRFTLTEDHKIHNFNDIKQELEDRGSDNTSIIEPDWESIAIEEVDTAWGGKTIKATFTDPLLHGYSVLLIADTVPEGYDVTSQEYTESEGVVPERITTMVMRFPRCILPEVNTHRVFSRNSASSRARSFKTTLEPIMEDAYVPLFTRNQKGMGGGWVNGKTYLTASRYWMYDRDYAIASTLRLLLGDKFIQDKVGVMNWDANYTYMIVHNWRELIDDYMEHYKADDVDEYDMPSIHKQNANRLLEPFMWHEALVTSTYWKNFLDLRISDGAQPEIKALAVLVRAVLHEHVPTPSWVHLPFGDPDALPLDDWGKTSDALLAAASECARISYKDRSSMKNNDNSALGRKLLEQKHMSPFEHIAFDAKSDVMEDASELAPLREAVEAHGTQSNLSPSWIQYRRVVSAMEQ